MGGARPARSHLNRLRGDSSWLDLDECRAQFFTVVCREVRTRLTLIASFSELLRGETDKLSAEGVQFFDIIERNVGRLLRLIDDLLMLDRIQAGRLPLELAQVSIPELAADAVRKATPVAAKSGITIHLDAGDGPLTRADPRLVLQVLDNVVGNAVKFSDVGGLVRVVTRYARSTWRIGVSDTGIGIPPGEAARLFSPFARGTNARTAGLPGVGLGLSIVKALVEMHGGYVKMHSVLGKGTTFRVVLPLHAVPVAP